jgi:hypothetical protein
MAPDVSLTGVWMRKSTWRAPRPGAAPATALVIDSGHAVLISSGAVFTGPVN